MLYPVFGLLLSPIIAAAAMSFSSVSVASRALRLKRTELRVSGMRQMFFTEKENDNVGLHGQL